MSLLTNLVKQKKRSIINKYAKADDLKGLTQVVVTLTSLVVLWCVVVLGADVSYWLSAAATLLISLFLLRVFVSMHECGHASMFHAAWLNRVFGFVFGVISGMPQYVWSQHHAYHHVNNGNWQKYRGPLNILSVDEYTAMTDKQQLVYRRERNVWLAPFGGFMYLIFNPRLTWIKGNFGLLRHVVERKIAEPGVSMRAHAARFETSSWKDAAEYWHMFWNNVVLLSGWVLMSLTIGPALFFTVYLISISLAGGAAIVLFTVQHNFEYSYATDSEGWDYDTAAMRGSSFLVLPRWLNWFTLNIAYHHVHHLSAKIPNYRLAECHSEHQELFSHVTRIELSGIYAALKYILWDIRSQRIISVAEYQKISR